MWELVFGGAALLVGGVTILCSVLESENKQKAQYIRQKSNEHREWIRKQQAELQQYQNVCDQSTLLASLRVKIELTKKMSDEAYKNYKSMKDSVISYKQQMNAAYEKINELKIQINSLKDTNYSKEEIKRLRNEKNGLYKFLEETKKLKESSEKTLEALYKDLKQLNNMVKNIASQIRESKSITYQSVNCVDCGSTFELSNGEVEFYNKKNMSLPKRCPICRKNRIRY